MKIALIGAQGVGKTTLLNSLRKEKIFNDYVFIDEIVRGLTKKYDINVNENGDDFSHLLIAGEHLKNFLNKKNKNMITDRSIIDNYVYTEYLYKEGKISKYVFDYIKRLMNEMISKFDFIFYIRPEFEIKKDGFRSVDEKFQKDIDSIYYKIFIANSNIIKITGSVEERVKAIKKEKRINE